MEQSSAYWLHVAYEGRIRRVLCVSNSLQLWTIVDNDRRAEDNQAISSGWICPYIGIVAMWTQLGRGISARNLDKLIVFIDQNRRGQFLTVVFPFSLHQKVLIAIDCYLQIRIEYILNSL